MPPIRYPVVVEYQIIQLSINSNLVDSVRRDCSSTASGSRRIDSRLLTVQLSGKNDIVVDARSGLLVVSVRLKKLQVRKEHDG